VAGLAPTSCLKYWDADLHRTKVLKMWQFEDRGFRLRAARGSTTGLPRFRDSMTRLQPREGPWVWSRRECQAVSADSAHAGLAEPRPMLIIATDVATLARIAMPIPNVHARGR
jgi:hypothetical protein